MVATKNKTSDPERMFIMAKNNLGPTLGAFGFSIVGAPLKDRPDIIASRVIWGEHIEGTARDLLAEAEDDGKGSDRDGSGGRLGAQEFLTTALANGERRQKEIAAEADAQGFSCDQIFRASKALDVIKRKDGLTGGWLWRLPIAF